MHGDEEYSPSRCAATITCLHGCSCKTGVPANLEAHACIVKERRLSACHTDHLNLLVRRHTWPSLHKNSSVCAHRKMLIESSSVYSACGCYVHGWSWMDGWSPGWSWHKTVIYTLLMSYMYMYLSPSSTSRACRRKHVHILKRSSLKFSTFVQRRKISYAKQAYT